MSQKQINDGGPAFPSSGIIESDPSEEYGIAGVKRPFNFAGMTLRDYFAAKAMQARIITLGKHQHDGCTLEKAESGMLDCKAETARRSYQMADAMLAERSKPEGTK